MAENDVNRLIDMLYERVEDAKSPALKPNLSMVDRDEILDLLDELRSQMPVELKRAQELLAAREKFVDEAKRDVERMMRQADRRQGKGPEDHCGCRGSLPPAVSGCQRICRGRAGPHGGGGSGGTV